MRALCRTFLVSAVVGGCVAASACSLFTSLEGYGSGEISQEPADAAAGADAVASETSVSDSGDDGGGDTSPFCASLMPRPTICEDFDSEPPLDGWNVSEIGTGSNVATTTGTFRSAPAALRAEIGSSPETRRAYIDRSLGTVVSHARLGYSLYIDERPTSGELEVNVLRFNSAQGAGDFFLSVTPADVSYVQQRGDRTTIPLSRSIPLKTWVRIELEVVLTGAKTVTVRVDGIEAAKEPAIYAIPATPRVAAGITYTGSSPDAGVVLVDDLTFEILE